MKTVLITERTDASIGLRLAGIESVCTRSAEKAAAALEEISRDENVGVLLITPGIDQMCPELTAEIRAKGRPLIVSVPDGRHENTNAIKEYIQNAIGIKLD